MGPTECSVQKGKGSSRWEYRRANISRRHGFTLVELLVVIVIIGILAAIITPVAFNALNNARNAAISLELSKLSAALEAYKNEYGSYPPDMTDPQHAIRHLSRLFPRQHPLEKEEFLELTLDPAEALVFWLRGFYPDPTHPLTGDSNHDEQPDIERGIALFEFPLAQLTDVDGDNLLEYSPTKHCKGTPVVYFDSRGNYQLRDQSDNVVLKVYQPDPRAKIIGTASPYALPVVPPPPINEIQFCESDSFQLISSGQDRHYSAWSNSQYKTYPEWNGQSVVYQSYTDENKNNYDDDNITNFSNGKMLGSAE